jgi:UDP-glucose 4-epimerase
VLGDGRQTRDFTYVADVVAATRAAADAAGAAGRALNVGGGGATSLREVVDLLGGFAGRALDLAFEDAQTGDVRHTAADVRRARDVLSWSPRTALPDGLRAQWDWAAAAAQSPPAHARAA